MLAVKNLLIKRKSLFSELISVNFDDVPIAKLLLPHMLRQEGFGLIMHFKS